MELALAPEITPVATAEILIFGGSFSPPTVGHVALIESALQTNRFDEIWVMPCRDRSDKEPTANETDRLAMVQLMVSECFGEQPVFATSFEYDLPIPTQTYITHLALENEFPENHFTYLIGEDSLATMQQWEFGEYLLSDLDWLIAPRATNVTPIRKPDHISKLPFTEVPTSSTEVRQRIKSSLTIKELVSQQTLKYIESKGLYK